MRLYFFCYSLICVSAALVRAAETQTIKEAAETQKLKEMLKDTQAPHAQKILKKLQILKTSHKTSSLLDKKTLLRGAAQKLQSAKPQRALDVKDDLLKAIRNPRSGDFHDHDIASAKRATPLARDFASYKAKMVKRDVST